MTNSWTKDGKNIEIPLKTMRTTSFGFLGDFVSNLPKQSYTPAHEIEISGKE
jgi:hypothetical protein